MARWLDQILNSTRENEAPSRFFYWAALTSISAVVKKNVYLERFYYKLYPNIYTFIVAKSGMKKGIPVSLAKALVSKVNNTRIISGRNSVQAIVRDLSKAFSTEEGLVIKDAHGFLVSGELASFLIKDPDALTILTDIYDTHSYEKEWTNSLKQSDREKLKSPCLCMLGATNEIHFNDAVPPNAIGGGFIARTFIIYADERGTVNPLTEKPTHIVDVDSLAEYLNTIKDVKGVFNWSDDAKDLYENWYYKYVMETHNDPTGTMERMPDQILKAAMLISLSESPNLILSKRNIEEALSVALECVAGVKQVTMGAGKSALAYQTKLVLRELIERPDHKTTRAKLLMKYWGELDSFDLDRIIETLLSAGAIEITNDRKTYILKKGTLEMYTQYKTKKDKT